MSDKVSSRAVVRALTGARDVTEGRFLRPDEARDDMHGALRIIGRALVVACAMAGAVGLGYASAAYGIFP